jgi:hypothetical protein
MNSQLLDFDRLLLILFAVLLLRLGWQLYAPRPQAQVEERQSAPTPTLEAPLAQGLPTLLSGLEPGVPPNPA